MSASEPPPYEFTTDWFSGHLGHWRPILAPLRGVPGLRFLEIGSFEGRSAVWLLENVLTHPSAHLTCIDLFGSGRPVYGAADFAEVRRRCTGNLARFGDRVTLLEEPSSRALRSARFAEESLDFVYIDGSHVARHVLEDTVLSWRLLRPGGVLIFDDYTWGLEPDRKNCPGMAVDAFLEIYAGWYHVLHKGYQVALQKAAAEP